MEIRKHKIQHTGIKIQIFENNIDIGHVYLYVLHNDLHTEPFGFMEDIFVKEEYRGKGIGKQLIEVVILEAKNQGCYKLIGTTRNTKPDIQKMYVRYNFIDYGKEFRMDF